MLELGGLAGTCVGFGIGGAFLGELIGDGMRTGGLSPLRGGGGSSVAGRLELRFAGCSSSTLSVLSWPVSSSPDAFALRFGRLAFSAPF
jgi:hypothetical protein